MDGRKWIWLLAGWRTSVPKALPGLVPFCLGISVCLPRFGASQDSLSFLLVFLLKKRNHSFLPKLMDKTFPPLFLDTIIHLV